MIKVVLVGNFLGRKRICKNGSKQRINLWNRFWGYLCNMTTTKNARNFRNFYKCEPHIECLGRKLYFFYDLSPININSTYFGLFWSTRRRKKESGIILDLVIYRRQERSWRQTLKLMNISRKLLFLLILIYVLFLASYEPLKRKQFLCFFKKKSIT